MRFEIKLREETIGYSDLEFGDPPMGVAGGLLEPTAAYQSFQPYCIVNRGKWTPDSGLSAHIVGGAKLSCQCIVIEDDTAELAADGLRVEVMGIPYPLYEELFPGHVEAYRNQFKK